MSCLTLCENCDREAAKTCDCSVNFRFFCTECASEHSNAPGTHCIKDALVSLSQKNANIIQEAFAEYQKASIARAKLSVKEIQDRFSEVIKRAEKHCSSIIERTSKGRMIRNIEEVCLLRSLPLFSQDSLLEFLVSLNESGEFTKQNIYKYLSSFSYHDEGILQEILSISRRLPRFSEDSTASTSASTPSIYPEMELSHKFKAHSDGINAIAISEDKKYFATASRDNTVKVWDLNSLQKKYVLEGHMGSVRSVAFLGHKIVTGSYDFCIKIWQGNECEKTLRLHDREVHSVCISSSKQLIASGGEDEIAIIYHLQSRKTLHRLRGHSNIVTSVDFSPDDRELVSGSMDRTVKIWKTETGELLQNLTDHGDSVLCVNYSRRFIATTSIDRNIILWHKNHEKPHFGFRKAGSLTGHIGRVECVDLEENLLISLSKDGTIRNWNTNNQQMIQTVEGHGDFIWAIDPIQYSGGLKIVQGENIAVSGGYDGCVQVWKLDN